MSTLRRQKKIFQTLPKDEIKYPDYRELDVNLYLQDRRIEILQKLFEEHKEHPIYLRVKGATIEEINAIRDAMIENPRFTFFCLKPDNFSLMESLFYELVTCRFFQQF
jgi:hypothetical protein